MTAIEASCATNDTLQSEQNSKEDDYGEWREVPGINASALLVSSNGWVRTPQPGRFAGGDNPLGPPKLGTKTKHGTYRVHQGKEKTHSMHCLVALAFHGQPPTAAHTVDHIDRNPSNNAASNLRWATRSEQSLNQGSHKRRRNGKRIALVTESGDRIVYETISDAAEAIGASNANITCAIATSTKIKGHRAFHEAIEEQGDLVVDGEVEQWKVVPFDDTIFVSSMGRIQRFCRGKWGVRRSVEPNKTSGGYCFIQSKDKSLLLHRVIMETFIGKDPDPLKDTVDHVNQIRHDNRLSNLKWASNEQQALNQKRQKVRPSELQLRPPNIEDAIRGVHYRASDPRDWYTVRMHLGQLKWNLHRGKA